MGQKTDTGVTSHIALALRASSNHDSPDPERVATKEVSIEPRLLLVDDKPELLKSLSEVVRLHGYRVSEALGGQAALEMLDTQEFDVVLLDLIMPDVNGYDVLEFAASRKLAAKFIVVSGDAGFSPASDER